MDDTFRFGIEEEYFLADGQTGRTPPGEVADRFHEQAVAAVAPARHELLKGQIEVSTIPGASSASACDALRGFRRDLSAIAAEHGLLVFAAGSHPLGEAKAQATTEQERYETLKNEFGIIAQRSMCCAMHVHVEVPDPSTRIGVMNRLLPYLPLLLALSTSSPFWQSRESGLRGFRLAAFSEWPRMGLPEILRDDADYGRLVDLLVAGGTMADASFIWWLIRPSAHYPTIELRIADSCTRVEDAVAIAALYRCLVRCVVRRPDLNAGIGPVERAVCAENVWQAQRHGTGARFVDAGRDGTPVSLSDTLEAVLATVAEDAEALGCAAEIAATRAIARDGSSADRQLALYRQVQARGVAASDALREVILSLAQTTAA